MNFLLYRLYSINSLHCERVTQQNATKLDRSQYNHWSSLHCKSHSCIVDNFVECKGSALVLYWCGSQSWRGVRVIHSQSLSLGTVGPWALHLIYMNDSSLRICISPHLPLLCLIVTPETPPETTAKTEQAAMSTSIRYTISYFQL